MLDFGEEKPQKIDRKRQIETLGISAGALRIKAFGVPRQLQKCVALPGRVDGQGGIALAIGRPFRSARSKPRCYLQVLWARVWIK